MKKIIMCIFIYALSVNFNAFAVDLELTDVIKQARETQMQKELAVKNTVKEIEDKAAAENTANAEKPIKEETQKGISTN